MKRIIIATYISLIIAYTLLLSCSQTHHFNKFIQKGGKIDTTERIITITDTIQSKKGKDSIVYKDVSVNCPEPIINTRWKTRYKFKTIKQYIKADATKYNDSSSNAIKQAKIDLKADKQEQKTNRTVVRQENKGSNWYVWLLVGFALGAIIVIYIKKWLKFLI